MSAALLLLAAALLAETPSATDGGGPLTARPLPGLKADVAALLMSGRESGALRAAVLAVPWPHEDEAAGETAPVDLWVEIDGGRLVGDEAPDEGTLRVEVHAYALAPSGSLAGALSQSFRLPLDELGADLAEGGVKFGGRLRLAPGEYDLRVLVRETRTQRFVLRVLPLVVPGPGGPFPEPPLFADATGAWIAVRATGDAAPSADAAPAALPVLAAGRQHQARLRAGVGARLLDGERHPVADLDLERAPGEPGDARFELPADLATGNYVLETYVDAPGRPSTTLPLYVLGRERDEGAIAWTAIERLAARPARRREALELAAKRRTKKRAEMLVGAYRDALEHLATGAGAEALDELADLEREVLEAPEVDARTWLVAAQDEVLGRLAAIDPESLVPVLFLHMQSHERYAGARDAHLTFHARDRVIATARLYARTAKSELAPSFAAAALSGMGVALVQSRMPLAGRRMVEEALALDGRNTAALMELALDHERRGEYAPAAAHLQRLLDIEPRSGEGRLRLGLNLRRMGEPRLAGRWLRRVIDDGAEEWLLALAYQELARLLIAQGRPERAVKLLETGVRRLPRQRRLAVLLAYAHDRNGESHDGREALAAGLARPDGVGPSPRLLYSRRPQDHGGPGGPDLLSHSTARLAVLAAALARYEEKR